MNSIVLYTMTSGLGDYLIMGDVMQKVEKILPEVETLMVHRENPHIQLWPDGNINERFYNIYSPLEVFKLIQKLRRAKKQGTTILGLQMAPGSLQGFFWYLFLKKVGALDYIVDFNLINADIITPPEGKYLLDLQLNQIKNLFSVEIAKEWYRLNLPIQLKPQTSDIKSKKIRVGIHPWSRRGELPCFVWTFEKWKEVINFLKKRSDVEIVIFGRDKKFEGFKNYLKSQPELDPNDIQFCPSSDVPSLVNIIHGIDIILTVNTSVVHIGYALDKKMVVLCGPTLDLWMPKSEKIKVVYDKKATLNGSDKYIADERFPSVNRIKVSEVNVAVLELFK